MRSLRILLKLLLLVGVAQGLTLRAHPRLRRGWTWFLLPLDLLLFARTHQHLVHHGFRALLLDPLTRAYTLAHAALAMDLVIQVAAGLLVLLRPSWKRAWVAFAIWASMLAGLGRGFWEAYAAPVVTAVEVRLPGLPPALDGLRILHGSDFHSGPFTTPDFFARGRAVAEAQHPDLVVLTGDYVDTSAFELQDLEKAYAGWRAPLGIYAVLGNHDHYREPESIAVRLRDLGIRVLNDEAVQVRKDGATLWLLGLDDAETDIEQVDRQPEWQPRPPFEGTSILLTHRPSGWIQARRIGVPLTLAGHTHGGQINPIPGLPTAQWMKGPWISGRYEDGRGHQLVVSRGLGMTGLPFRFRARAEWVLVTLRDR